MAFYYSKITAPSRAGFNPTSHVNAGPYGGVSKSSNGSTSRNTGVSTKAFPRETPPFSAYKSITGRVGAGPSYAVYGQAVNNPATGPAIRPS